MNAGMPDALAQAVRDFLVRHAPFDRMTADDLAFVVPRLELAYFAEGREIAGPGKAPASELYLIQRGRVGSRSGDASATPDATLGPGEMFPVGALSAGTAASRVYVALHDTFAYVLGRDDFLALRARSEVFERYCASAVAETLRQSLAQLASRYGERAAEEQALAHRLADLVRRGPVTCPAAGPLADALVAMNEQRVRTIIATDGDGRPIGVFTLVDLLRRVALPRRSLDIALREVMSSPIVVLPGSATANEALALMADRGIRQIVVADGDRPLGVVNERDLFALQRVSMRQVVEGIRDAPSLDALAATAGDVRRLARNLLAQGVAAEPLTRTISSINDAMTRRVLEMTLAAHDVSDLDWCWLALGSEGRGEQTLATDQDNALLFVAPATGTVEQARARLTAFGGAVNDALARLGFPRCRGGVMAGNPAMCLTLDEWKARFLGWLSEPTPQALLESNIVFDFRALYGDTTLTDELARWLHGYSTGSTLFLRLMVANALQTTPPLGLLRAFAVDDDAAHPGTLDLKVRGTRVFVDAARVFALGKGIAESGTAERLRRAGVAIGVEARHVEAAIDAFHFLQLQRLRLQDVEGGEPNRLDPDKLNEVEQRMLKEAFRQARKLQERLAQTFNA
jgi:CBS domain-containing protein